MRKRVHPPPGRNLNCSEARLQNHLRRVSFDIRIRDRQIATLMSRPLQLEISGDNFMGLENVFLLQSSTNSTPKTAYLSALSTVKTL